VIATAFDSINDPAFGGDRMELLGDCFGDAFQGWNQSVPFIEWRSVLTIDQVLFAVVASMRGDL
jgi:hypothetical protein